MHSTARAAKPISREKRAQTSEITANGDACDRTSARQSVLLLATLKAEIILGAAVQGTPEPIIGVPAASLTLSAEWTTNPIWSQTGKNTDNDQRTPNPAPQPQPVARPAEVQPGLLTPGRGNEEPTPRKSTPKMGTDENVVQQIQDYVIERVVGSEQDEAEKV